ncbi:MAG: serine/threonine protein kinase [Symploca sp. SIO2E6]|nr:serine/threonine protein kinase [Symploca sp. SIO2E6]
MSILELSTSNGAKTESLLHGRYQPVEVLENRGLGQTLIALDTQQPDHPECVIKQHRLLDNNRESLETARHLFQTEAQILKTLGSHDQIAQLLDYFEVEQTFSVVQEFIFGYPLGAELSQEQRWTEGEVVMFLHEVLDILEYAHSQGVIHGAIQPDNLIRREQDGRLVLTDFSAIRQVRAPLLPTQEQVCLTMSMGALEYMSVEQLRGKPRPSNDIYALGMIAIQGLTGMRPDQLPEDPETGEVVWQQEAQVSEAIATILSKMVSYHFKDRYQSAAEVLAAFKSLEAGEPEVPPQRINQFINLKTAGVATSLALAVGGYSFFEHYNPLNPGLNTLAQAEQKYQEGELDEAFQLAESIATNSAAYEDAQNAIAQWQENWDQAEAQVQAIEQAFEQNQWQEVIDQAAQIPDIDFWQQQITEKVEQAKLKLEQEAEELLLQAYSQAMDKDFTGALQTLKAIPPGTKVYQEVQNKTVEYKEKQQIRARYFLHQAYKQAIEKNFTTALAYLRKVPQGTTVYDQVREKIAEYEEKQQVKAIYLLHRANNRAIVGDYSGALEYLQQIPEGTPAYAQAQAKIAEYTAQQDNQNSSQEEATAGRSSQDDASQEEATASRSSNNDSSTTQPFNEEPFTSSNSGSGDSTEDLFSGSDFFGSTLNPGTNLQEIIPGS